MTAASYPDKLSFQRRTLTTAASGQQVESWDTIFHRYGKVEQSAAGEVNQNDQQKAVESYALRFPYDSVASQLSSIAWRVVWRDQRAVERTLFLTGVDSAGAGRLPEITLTAVRSFNG